MLPLFAFGAWTPVSAQFKGGPGAGYIVARATLASLGRNIFMGGTEDGTAAILKATQPLGRNIFKGGVDDGTNATRVAAAPLGRNIFKGGVDDGTNVVRVAAAALGRNIFKGGNDDGSAAILKATQPLGRNIFKGGADDGWAVSYSHDVTLVVPLPVILSGFTGHWQDKDALLEWTTSSEINSDFFELQRSFDGADYMAIGTVAAAGESNETLHYQYIDLNMKTSAPPGVTSIYYRLRSVDRDGRTAFSGVVILRLDRSSSITYSMFPNPARETVTITTNDPAFAGNLFVQWYDASGKLVMQQQMTESTQHFSVSALNNGTYFLQLVDSHNVLYTQKVIIQK